MTGAGIYRAEQVLDELARTGHRQAGAPSTMWWACLLPLLGAAGSPSEIIALVDSAIF